MSRETPKNLPLSLKIVYSLGQLGWSLASFGVAGLLTYFYLPPETGGKSPFPVLIDQGFVLGILTIIGLVMAAGRVFDAFTDPLVASLSDRSRSRFGKRRIFMAVSLVPFAVFSILPFLPPMPAPGIINNLWLFGTVLLFYWFFTLYVTPFFALMSEYGHTEKERMTLSTLTAATYLIGYAVGGQVYTLQGIFEKSMSPVQSFQLTLVIFAVIAALLMALPVFLIDENKYSSGGISEENLFVSIRNAWKNKNFRVFIISDLSYWIMMVSIQQGIIYYVQVLLGLDKSLASLSLTILVAMSVLFYAPVNILTNKIGKKKMMVGGFIWFLAVFVFLLFIGRLPIAPVIQAYAFIIAASVPIAIFGILPNALVADIAREDTVASGQNRAGIYFGARTFMQKLGIMLGGVFFSSLINLGRSPENPLGVRLTIAVELVFCLAGLIVFLFYREHRAGKEHLK